MMGTNPRTGRPFISPRFADLLSEPDLFGLGRKASPEADSMKHQPRELAEETPTAGCFVGEFCDHPDCPDFNR